MNDPALAGLALRREAEGSNRSTLGQEEFLSLMIAQLRNQDPMKPMENGEFIGQMAQFSTVSGIGEMTRSVAELSDTYRASQTLSAAGIVGRTVLAEGDRGSLPAGGALEGAIEVPMSTPAAHLRVYDASDTLVRQVPLGEQRPGLVDFGWDGTRTDGTPASPGQYTVRAAIATPDGELEVPVFVASRVQSITLDGNGSNALLDTDSGALIRLSDVKVIR